MGIFMKKLFKGMTINKKTLLIGVIIVVLTILIDQITKIYMENLLVNEGNSIVVIKDFFKFQLHYNTGAAFSSFDGNFVFLKFTLSKNSNLNTAMLGHLSKESNFPELAYQTVVDELMIGGMIGNFIDRVFRFGQGVVDFLSFTFFGWDFAVFNMADTFLVIGVIAVIIDLLFFFIDFFI